MMFRVRLPLIFRISHKMPHLPRNLHLVTTRHGPDNGFCKKTRNTTPLKRCACHAKWRWRSPKCCACHEKCKSSSETTQKYCACRAQRFSTGYETCWNVEMSQSATPATRNEATRHLKPPKVTTFAELAIGTAMLHSRRSLAVGCGRLQTQNQRRANTPKPPDPKVKQETLRYAFGKKNSHKGKRANKKQYIGDFSGQLHQGCILGFACFCCFVLCFCLALGC